MVQGQKVVYSRLSQKIAEEKQLLDEEKWIIEALKQVKKQRNSLQIEQLELQSQLVSSRAPRLGSVHPRSLQSAASLMASNPVAVSAPGHELEEALVNELHAEELCNNQNLDLTVTNPMFSANAENMEEVEEDSAGSEDETNSFFIDMNMLMNGVTQNTAQS